MKIKKASEILWFLGIIFVALGVAVCGKANLGVSMIAAPAFIISEALLPICKIFTVGVTEYLLQAILLIILVLVLRKFNWRYLLTFAVAVIYGYTLNFFIWLLRDFTVNAIFARFVMLIVGDILVAFGVACFFRTYMPLQAHEKFVKDIVNKFGLNLGKTKWVFDISFLALSVIFALTLFGDAKSFDWSTIYYNSFHNIGLGTIVTTLINSPIINLCGKIVDLVFEKNARFPQIADFLSEKQ